MNRERLKRSVDLLVAIPLFIVSLPLQILIGLAIFLFMGPPILFVQTRPGLHGISFPLVKFRTMVPSGTGDKFGRSRVTRLGAWLRKTSLDEMPELWNVIKGDMSLVGPRPLLSEYLTLYSPEQARRHDVKPGITGLAQVSGRNLLSWERRFKYDVWYARHQSLCLDCRIMVMTLAALFRLTEVNHSESMTMEPFRGKGGKK